MERGGSCSPTLRKVREGWGTQFLGQDSLFSRCGHPGLVVESAMERGGLCSPTLRKVREGWGTQLWGWDAVGNAAGGAWVLSQV
jgi:hypothetical protein